MADIREAKSPAAKPKRYIVLSDTRGPMELEINKHAENGYRPILMSTSGDTIFVILEHDSQ
jgi:hypothetical protein